LASLGTMAAGLAHELRNPLNAAHLQLNVAQRRLAQKNATELSRARKAVELAQSEMKRLADLVADFLRFAKPQPLRLICADLRATAQVIVDLLAPTATEQGVALDLVPGPPVSVEMDEEKMKQVLLNLVRNAIEASPPSTRVRVRVEARDAWAHLSVEDAGQGVSPDASVSVFEPFFTTKDTGTGLGLSIVHRIALDHGGSVSFESVPGHTVFRVALPQQSA
jgi:two-component system sensor histidine kinase HydH